NRVGVEREPCRRLRRRGVSGFVAAAAPEIADRSVCGYTPSIECETDPRVVFEAAALDGIYCDFELRRCGGEPVEYGTQSHPLGARPFRQIKAVESGQGGRGGSRRPGENAS